jgi:hypothetical protein
LSIFDESRFRFDFSAASGGATIHDKNDDGCDGNTVWPGVDFRVKEANKEVWIEVKSWSLQSILDRASRRGAHRDFTIKMAADQFRDDIVAKFLGTTSFLAWSGIGIPQKVNFVVFLEPPNRATRALLSPFKDRLRDEFKNAQARAWGRKLGFMVVDFELFTSEFPAYPVTRL